MIGKKMIRACEKDTTCKSLVSLGTAASSSKVGGPQKVKNGRKSDDKLFPTQLIAHDPSIPGT